MHRRAVEALGEVPRQQLPVRLHVGAGALAEAQFAQAVALELCIPFPDVEQLGLAPGEVEENEAAPGCDRDLVQRKVAELKVRCFHAPRRRDELPGKVVGPRVIRADDALAREVAVLFSAQNLAAIPPGYLYTPQLAAFISDDNQGLRADPR